MAVGLHCIQHIRCCRHVLVSKGAEGQESEKGEGRIEQKVHVLACIVSDIFRLTKFSGSKAGRREDMAETGGKLHVDYQSGSSFSSVPYTLYLTR